MEILAVRMRYAAGESWVVGIYRPRKNVLEGRGRSVDCNEGRPRGVLVRVTWRVGLGISAWGHSIAAMIA